MARQPGKRLVDRIQSDLRRTRWLAGAFELVQMPPGDQRIIVSDLRSPGTQVPVTSYERWFQLRKEQRSLDKAARARP